MKPQPLKGKTLQFLLHPHENIFVKGFEEKDIRSAVEWLLDSVECLDINEQLTIENVHKDIEKAFEDVMK